MKAPDLVQWSQQVLSDPSSLGQRLRDDEDFVSQVASGGAVSPRPEVVEEAGAMEMEAGVILEDPRAREEAVLDRSLEEPRREVLKAGARALTKVEEEGEAADFTPEEAVGLEAIIHLVGRPAILIQNGSFFAPPDEWKSLDDVRPEIEDVISRVGRVEVEGHPNFEWVGTGFMVSDAVLMTNRHVAREFARRDNQSWSFWPGMSARVDFREELGTVRPVEFALEEILGIHETLDLALLRVSDTGSDTTSLPGPLPISSQGPESLDGTSVYTIGYPAWDGRRNDPDVMRRLFSDVYNVKRLQPGKTKGEGEAVFFHDCSTLGGNSGSCVVDLARHQVVGLHFGGRYRERNAAIALWELAEDELIRGVGLNWS